MMKLYDFLPCPYGQKVRIVLAEKGLSYELVEIDLAQGEQRQPDFRRLNPLGRVPVLIDEEATIYDSTVIDEYVEDEYPEPPLLPSVGASFLRARARMLEDFADGVFTPEVGRLMAEMGKSEGERDGSRVQLLHQRIEGMLTFLNHELQGQDFLASQFSVADIGFVPRILLLKDLGLDPATSRPNIDRWINRLIDRPSITNLQGLTLHPVAGV